MINSNEIQEAINWLNKNTVVAIPTETVYGLAANIYNKNAIQEIYTIKNRPLNNPLIVHIKSVTELKKYTQNVPEKAMQLATTFWPGPLTLVLEKSDLVPDYITSGKDTVAIRVPAHPVTLQLLENLDFPIAAPSANPSNCVSATSAGHVKNYFENKIPYVLDGGNCEKGLESTIIGFENNEPVVYRLGALSLEKIEAVIGKVTVIKSKSDKNPSAPGMFLKHYAPKTPLYLVDSISEFLTNSNYTSIAYLGFDKEIQHPRIKANFLLSNTKDFDEAGANLYKTLIEIDTLNRFDAILTRKFPNKNIGKSINDRLTRASYKTNI